MDTIFAGIAGDAIFGDDEVQSSSDGREPGGTQIAALRDTPGTFASPSFQTDAAKVVIPAGQTVVHVAVAPGATVELPFGADAQFLGKLGNGNLAIKVGDITIILEGYADAATDPARPVVVTAADGTPLDIAALLAATDPSIDIETAAGPGGEGGQGGRSASNTGGVFTFFGSGGKGGEGGFVGEGVQDGTTPPQGGAGGNGGFFFGNGGAGGNGGAPVNAAPETKAVQAAGEEDTHSVAVELSGTDSDGSVAAFVISSLPVGGTLYADATLTLPLALGDAVAAAGNAATVHFVPDLDFNGTITFQYAARDNGGALDATPATATVQVDAVNDAPVVTAPTSVQLDEDSGATAIPGLSVADVDAGPFAIQVTVSVTYGTLDLSGNNVTIDGAGSNAVTLDGTAADINAALATLTYTPAANFYGTDPLVIHSDDLGNTGAGGALQGSGGIDIQVNPVNDAPESYGASASGSEDAASIAVGLSGSDIDGTIAGFVLTSAPTGGTLYHDAALTMPVAIGQEIGAFGTTGTIYFVPDANFNGTVTFTYAAVDAEGAVDPTPATATITVNPVNDTPVAINDSYTTNEDTPLNIAAPGILGNDSDIDGDALHVSAVVTGPAHGTLQQNADGSFTYTPDANFNGTDSFTYRSNDGTADSNLATVNITVSPVNDAPVAINDSYTTSEDTPLNIAMPGILGNDSDPDGDALHVSAIVTGPAHGSLLQNADGSFTYTPDANFNGSDSFTYRSSDGTADSNNATVNITVNPLNDTPVAINDSYITNEDTPLNIAAPGILGNDSDIDGDALHVSAVVTGPAHGTLQQNADGSFTYMPDANFNGTDSFTYCSNDGTADSNLATVNITVSPVNDAPVAINDSYTTSEDTAVTISGAGILGNDSDADGDPLHVVLVTGPAHGTLSLNPDGSFTYTPDANFNGSDSFTYRSNDGTADSNNATVSITVNPVNDAPVAINDSYTTNEDTPLNIAAPGILGNDSDPDGDALHAVLVNGPAHGTLLQNAGGSFTYTPDANFNGTDSFTYRSNDGFADSNVATVNITVSPVNDAPVAINNAYTINQDTLLIAGSVLGNDTDIDGDPLTATLGSGPSHGTVDLHSDGTFTYMPGADFSGTDSFTYRANDGTTDSNTATVTITVNPAVVGDDLVLTNAGPGSAITIPFAALLANDGAGSSASGVHAAADSSAGTVSTTSSGVTFTFAPGADTGHFNYTSTQSGGVQHELTVSTSTVQSGFPIIGSTRHEILIGSDQADLLAGNGGHDLIFGNGGDDTITYHDGDRIDGGADSATGEDLWLWNAAGDQLLLFDNLNLADPAHAGTVKSIESISSQDGVGYTLTLDDLAVHDLSDHVRGTQGSAYYGPVVRFDGDALDQLYLSVTHDSLAANATSAWISLGSYGGINWYAHTTTYHGLDSNLVLYDSFVVTTVPTGNVQLNHDPAASAA